MAESNKGGAFASILGIVKDCASKAREKVKDLGIFDKVKGFTSTTTNWIKTKMEALKNIASRQKDGTEATAPTTPTANGKKDAAATTPNTAETPNGPKDAFGVVGLDFSDSSGKGNPDQSIVNIAQMNFMKESIAASADGKSFDSDAVGKKAANFMDYYGEFMDIDPKAKDATKKIEALDAKYGPEMADAFDKASETYETYKKQFDGIKDGKGQAAFAKLHADTAYACGDISIDDYAEVLKSKGESQVGVSAEVYANPKLAEQKTAEKPETANTKTGDTKSDEGFTTYTNLDLDAMTIGKGMSATYGRYAVLQYAKEIAKEGFVDPELLNTKFSAFADFMNKYVALDPTAKDFQKKVDDLKAASPEQAKMFDKFNDAMSKFSDDCDKYISAHHPQGAPSSVDKQILSIYKKGGYADKPDIDVSYALGHMSFEDYAKANGKNTLWRCSSKDEFNKCVAAVRSAGADNVAPKAGTEKTNDIEADND
jgi:hypothetical protein